MPPFLPVCVGVYDAAGNRVDTPDANGNFHPFFLQLETGLAGTKVPGGGAITVQIAATGISLGSVANIAALELYSAVGLANGATLAMASVKDEWQLVLSSPSTPDGITIVAAAGVAGANWHRRCLPSTYWLFQSEVHIDPSTGNDEASGAASGTPIKTCAEWHRRTSGYAVNATFYFYGSPPVGDTFHVPLAGPSSYILIEGVSTSLASSTLEGVTVINAAGQQALELTDSGVTWADLLCKRIVFANGAVCWAVKDLGSDTVRCTTPIIIDTSSPLATSFSTYTPLVGDAYEVQDVPTIDFVFDQPVSANFADGNFARVVFTSLNVSEESSPLVPAHGYPQGVVFLGCDVGYTRGVYYAWSCMGNGVLFRQSDYVYWYGGAFVADYGVVTIYANAFLELGQGALLQACVLDNQGSLSYTDSLGFAVFDAAGSAVVNEPGGVIQAAFSSAPMWGTNNTGYGVKAYDGSRFYHDGTLPIIDGTTAAVRFGGANHAWADFPLTSAGLATIGPRQA